MVQLVAPFSHLPMSISQGHGFFITVCMNGRRGESLAYIYVYMYMYSVRVTVLKPAIHGTAIPVMNYSLHTCTCI